LGRTLSGWDYAFCSRSRVTVLTVSFVVQIRDSRAAVPWRHLWSCPSRHLSAFQNCSENRNCSMIKHSRTTPRSPIVYRKSSVRLSLRPIASFFTPCIIIFISCLLNILLSFISFAKYYAVLIAW